MSRHLVMLLVAVTVAGSGCSTSRSGLVLDGYHFEFSGSPSIDADWPRVRAAGHVLEVRDDRILLDDVDHGPIRRGQVMHLSSRGRLTVDGVARRPTE